MKEEKEDGAKKTTGKKEVNSTSRKHAYDNKRSQAQIAHWSKIASKCVSFFQWDQA